MVVFLTWVLTRSVRAKTGIDATVVLLLLIMMVAMLIGPAYLYLVTLNFTIGDVAIWEIAVFMSVGMMPIGVLLFAKFWMMGDTERKGPLPLSGLLEHIPALRASYIGLLLLSELLMGWTFNLASGLISLSAGYSVEAVVSELSFSLVTYWFVFTMVGEMGLTLFAFRKILRSPLLVLLGLEALVMLLTPTAIPVSAWADYSLYLDAVAMTVLVLYAVVLLRRPAQRDRPLFVYLGLFIVLNTVMMLGILLWFATGELALVALSLAVGTAIYFDAVLTGAGLGQTFGDDPSAAAAPVTTAAA